MADSQRSGQPSMSAATDLADLIDRFAELCDAAPHERDRWLNELEQSDAGAARMLRRMLDAEASGEAQTLDTPLLDLDVELMDGHAAIDAMPSHAPGLGGRYEVLRPLGFGANGDVYLARQRQPVERDVAIKVLRPSQVRPSTVERMAREAQALAALSHPNIATVLEAGQTDDGRPFIATEYVAGESIDQWCTATMAPARVRIRMLALVCRAVEHMHQRGVIHRDLKPTNILVAGTPEDPQPKILDLGIARIIGEDGQAAPTLTQPGALLGSLGYIAPEQFEGAPADTRSDIFALGRVLERVLNKIEDQWLLRQGRDIAAIVAKAVEQDAARRYSSAGAMAEDLESLLAGHGVSARRPSVLELLARTVRRHPRHALAVFVGTAGLCIAAGIAVERSLAQAQALRDRSSVLELQKSLLTETLDGSVRILGRYAGTLEQRAEMATRLDSQLRSMLLLAPDDRDLRVLLARVGTERARISLARGDLDGAASLALDAVGSMRADIRPEIAPVEEIRHLGLALVVYGDCLAQMKSYDDATEAYRQALELHRDARTRFPRHVGLLDDLSWSLDRFSQPVSHDGIPAEWSDRAPWLVMAEERLELADDLLRIDPGRYLSRFNAAVARLKLGRIYCEHDDARAQELLIAAAQMLEALARQDPGRTAVHARLSTTWSVLAEMHARLGRPDQAISAQERAVAALIDAVGSQPMADAHLARNLQQQAGRLEALYATHGRLDDAQALRDRVARMNQPVVRGGPEDKE
ncbi:MAG: serine/threonine-protein kinase [Phycisphaerales bacterium]